MEGKGPRFRLLSMSGADKVDIENNARVKVKIQAFYEDFGVISVIALNLNRRARFRKHTFIGIHCTDIVPLNRLESFSHSVFKELNEGEVVEGKIAEIKRNLAGKIKNKIYISLSGSEAESQEVTLDPGNVVFSIVNECTEDGLVVYLNRHAKGILFCTDLSSDTEFLEELFSCSNTNKKLDMLQLTRFSPLKVKIKEKISDYLFAVVRG